MLSFYHSAHKYLVYLPHENQKWHLFFAYFPNLHIPELVRRGWRLLDLPLSFGGHQTGQVLHSSDMTPVISPVMPLALSPALPSGSEASTLSPLQHLVQHCLPRETLMSLKLRLGSPTSVFLSPPCPSLPKLIDLTLTNFTGCTGDHAMALMSTLPCLKKLSLSWPSWNARPQQLGAALPLQHSSPRMGSAATFWEVLGRMAGSLVQLQVTMQVAGGPPLPGLDGIPSNLTQLTSLELRLNQSTVMASDYQERLLAMGTLSHLTLHQVWRSAPL